MLGLPAILLMMPGFYAESQAARPGNGQGPDYRFSVDVNPVVLNATVRDRQGGFAADLSEQDFAVYEDGVPQHIRLFQHDDIPVTVGLVVDHSGSMRPRLRDVTAAARSFVQFSNSEDQMFVVNFNETVSMGLPETTRFSNDSAALGNAIWRSPAFGETALYDALVKALARLQEGHWDKKVLLVISDGGDNASAHTLAEILKTGERSGTLVYTIGIFEPDDPDKNPAVLKRLALESGGEAFFPAESGDVVAVCERIARDIRSQYTLGYVSNTASRAGYHTVRVVARGTGNRQLVVRTRSGYFDTRDVSK